MSIGNAPPPRTRKQREIAERRERILDAARDLLESDGYGGLSMDRLALRIDYSKGTVYQHFPCKEEVVLHLSLRAIATWQRMFERALGFHGRPRERLLAIHLAHALTARLCPVEYECIYTARGVGVREKVSREAESWQSDRLARLFDIPVGVVREGVAAGDLLRGSGSGPEQLVYGLWALHYGKITLGWYGFPFLNLETGDQRRALRRTFHALLDGFGWRPLASEHDYDAVERRIERELFASDLKGLRTRGI